MARVGASQDDAASADFRRSLRHKGGQGEEAEKQAERPSSATATVARLLEYLNAGFEAADGIHGRRPPTKVNVRLGCRARRGVLPDSCRYPAVCERER